MSDADLNLAAPNCPRCLTPMTVPDDNPARWACEACGLVALS